MTRSCTLAIDAMGGDLGPKATVAGAAMCLKEHAHLKFLIFGREKDIMPFLSAHPELKKVSEIIHTDSVVASSDKPSQALRTGRSSSMWMAIEAVAEGRADAIISSGNTGALMAMAKLCLRSLPEIRRPAIASVFPTKKGETIMLDLGANTVCDSDNLVQFALLGSIFARLVKNIPRPTVGLLNVGTEEMKGNDQVRVAGEILRDMNFPGLYYGYIEGTDIPAGTTDVVVTDGFTGNVALKVAEGTSELIGHFVKDAFRSSLMAFLGGLFAWGAMKKLKQRVDPRFYNGGMFLGLNGICVKSHGSSDAYGFSRALKVAADLVDNDYNMKVAAEIKAQQERETLSASPVGGLD
jgi:glycerol-3-phosphate acyltransferase PlsX